MVEHRTFCRLCTALCGLLVTTDGDRVVRVTGDRAHPISAGYTCPKGRSLGAHHHGSDRLDRPERREVDGLRPVSWTDALDDLGARVTDVVAAHGPDAVGAFFGSGAAFDGTSKVARKLFHALGTRSVYSAATVDAPCRPYVAELVTGNPSLFGRGVDFDHATLVLLVGLNPLVSHGHNAAFPDPRARIRRVLGRGEVWVVDPRRTETAAMATHHLAPRPGTDHVWLAAVVREILRTPTFEPARLLARNVDALVDAVEPFTLEQAAAVCDVPRRDLERLVDAISRHRVLSVVAGTGVSMTPAANVTEWLTWALSIVTGSLDERGGTVLNPGFLRPLDVGAWAASSAPAQGSPASRPDLPRRLNEQPSAAIVDEIEAGHLRALVVLGGNLVTALPQTERVVRALSSLDVLAVADVVRTETTALATHVLPCAGQLERSDLPVNVDATYPAIATQHTWPVVELGADRRPLWWVAASLASRLGLSILPGGRSLDECTDDVVLEHASRRSRLPLAALRATDGCVVHGPVTPGWVRRAVATHGGFDAAPPPLVTQLRELRHTSVDAALRLVPRRQLRHVNSQLVDGPTVGGRHDEPLAILHPGDAAAYGIVDGDEVEITSGHGALVVRARVDASVRRGVVSVPHGFGATNVNRLTTSDVADPLTGMVHYSAIDVRVRKISADLPCQPLPPCL